MSDSSSCCSSTPWSRLTSQPRGSDPTAATVRSVCVIGAGSSGLVAAKYLAAAGYEVAVYEKGDVVGGTFVSKAYDDSALVSSKFLTAFSDLRSPASDPPHLSMEAYVAYLKQYADEQELWPLIRFGTHVASIERRACCAVPCARHGDGGAASSGRLPGMKSLLLDGLAVLPYICLTRFGTRAIRGDEGLSLHCDGIDATAERRACVGFSLLAAMRLLGLTYRQAKRGVDMRGDMEDRGGGWKRLKTSEHYDKAPPARTTPHLSAPPLLRARE